MIIDLITRARTGDKQAWDMLVERYAPLVWSKLRRHPVTAALINTEAHSTRSDINGPKPMVQRS